MSDISTVTTTDSVSPMRRPSRRSFSASPPGSSRLRVSPCSSRSTIAWCSIRSRCSAPSAPLEASCASWRNRCSTSSLDRLGRGLAGDRDRLHRPALGDVAEQLLVLRREPAVVRDRLHEPVDDRRVERGAAGGHRADGLHQLVALGDAVLQQVGVAGRALAQQGDGVLGVVVLREHDDAGARVVALAHLLGRLDALALEARRHADVGDDDLRARPRRPRRRARRSRRPRRRPRCRPRGSRSACTPSRTRRLSSARNTVIWSTIGADHSSRDRGTD